jgi:hypothetical protein
MSPTNTRPSRLLIAALALPLAGAAAAPRATPRSPGARPVSDALVEAMRTLDEDGAVDGRDRVLIQALAKTEPAQWSKIAGATCAAAADLDLDGKVDATDAALADEWLAEGRIATPALFYQTALPCRFERLIAASQTDATGGEDLPLWILSPGYVKEDVEVKVEEGSARLKASGEPRTILLAVVADPKRPDGTLVVRISFRGGRSYLLSVPVAAAR